MSVGTFGKEKARAETRDKDPPGVITPPTTAAPKFT